MTGYSQRGGLTVTWTLENFTYCGLYYSHLLKTHCFDAYSTGMWFKLFPRGTDSWNYPSPFEHISFVVLYHEYISPENFGNLEYLYSILDADGAPLIWKEVKKDHEFVNLITRDELFGPRKNSFLPNDTLTIQCRIFKKGEAFSTPAFCFLRTRMKDERYFGKWEISEFSSLVPPRQIAKTFLPMTQYGKKLDVTLSLDNEERCKFNVQYVKSIDCVYASCKFKVLDATGKKIMFAESEHYFEFKSKPWEFT